MDKKLKELLDFSNPYKVHKKLEELFDGKIDLYLSSRKNKKYMIIDPNKNKMVHFGEMGYEDYTKHNDNDRRNDFRVRNDAWKNKDIFTPAYLSYHLLW